jgi:hypothetical protein
MVIYIIEFKLFIPFIKWYIEMSYATKAITYTKIVNKYEF